VEFKREKKKQTSHKIKNNVENIILERYMFIRNVE